MKTFSHTSTLSRVFRFKHALATGLALVVSMPFVSLETHAGTTDNFTKGTSLLSTGNYSGGLPSNTSDVNITEAGSLSLTVNNGAVVMESLTFTTATKTTDKIDNTTSGTGSTLTLGNSAGFTNVNDSVANDLLVLGGSASLTIGGSSTGTLGLVLASSGNFDNNGSGTLTIASSISESGGARTLTITGTGTDSFTGTNTFSGGLVVTAGELDVSGDGSLGAAGGSVTINGGRIAVTASGTVSASRNIYLGANPTGGNTTGTFSISGSTTTVAYNGVFQNLNGNTVGDFVKQGGGVLQLGGTSTYTGATFLNNGTTQITTANALPTGTTISIGQAGTVGSAKSNNVGAFDLNAFNQTIAGLNSTAYLGSGALSGQNTVTSSSGAATLTLAGTGTYAYGDGSTTNSGNITDSTAAATGTGVLALVKTGSGTQTLGGSNTYTGGTTVSGGSLVISNASGSSATGSGAVTVNNGGSLLGTGYINAGTNKVTINGTLSPGAGTGSTGTITLASTASTGALTLSSTSTLAFDITNPMTKDDVELSGSSLALNGGRLTLVLPDTTKTGIDYTATYALFTDVGSFSGSGFGSVTGYDNTDYTAKLTLNGSEYDLSFISAVPEPATILGGVLMIGLLGASQRRRVAGWMRVGVQ